MPTYIADTRSVTSWTLERAEVERLCLPEKPAGHVDEPEVIDQLGRLNEPPALAVRIGAEHGGTLERSCSDHDRPAPACDPRLLLESGSNLLVVAHRGR